MAQPFVNIIVEHYCELREYQQKNVSIKSMSLDTEEAAKEFWDYPDAQWQANFSKHWLYMNNPPRHEMFAAMDLAAKEFDEYPDGKWQAAFEASWFSTKS